MTLRSTGKMFVQKFDRGWLCGQILSWMGCWIWWGSLEAGLPQPWREMGKGLATLPMETHCKQEQSFPLLLWNSVLWSTFGPRLRWSLEMSGLGKTKTGHQWACYGWVSMTMLLCSVSSPDLAPTPGTFTLIPFIIANTCHNYSST